MSHRSFRNHRAFLPSALRFGVVLVLGLVGLVVLAGSGVAAVTNTAQLDNGTCGRNLQLGSDRTASNSATPTFLIAGDGGLSSYRAFVDGAEVGTFYSDGFANVCVYTSAPLADGPHVFTANELLPHSTWTITPFSFTVDTVPPSQPSTPTISGYSDSGVLGDHITMYRNVNFSGFADPNVTIQLYNGVSLLGGAKADAAGFWSATTATLADGNYTFTAAALDQAGNKSMLSLSCPLTIDGTAPTGALTSPITGSTVSGTVQFAATASDQVGIWKVDYKVDGTTKGTVTGSPPYSFAWSSLQVTDGPHTVTGLITDFAGNTVSSTVNVNVQNSGATPTAPTAPTLNSATAGNASVTLNWSVPTSDGGSAITGYRVYRSNTSGAETLLTTLGPATSFTDTGLTNGSTYYYKVSAVNSVGESSLSSERSAIPAATPDAPTLNAPTAGNTMVTLTWATPNGNGSTVTGYRVYRSTSSGTETLYTTISALNAFTDSGLTNGTTYYYRLTALNAIGESSLSNERSATPATVPSAPTLNSATAGNGTVGLSWTTPNSSGSALTGYRVYRSTTSGNETLLTTLGLVNSYTDTAVNNGTTYYYKVTALNALGESSLSNERSASPATLPGAPTLNPATGGSASVTLSWSAPASDGGSSLTGYRVYRSTSSGNETLLIALGLVNGYTDTAVSNGTTYYYKVTALNAVGESGLSSERSATPTAAPTVPGAPTLNAPTAGNATVGLTWTTPNSNGSSLTGYRVYRSTTSGAETLLTTLGVVNSYTDTAVNGTTYYYKVTALNAVGESSLSNERSASPATTPSAPTLNAATSGNGSVDLSWTTPSANGSALTGYRVFRSTSSGAETLLTTVGLVNSYTDTGLTNGSTYYYKVSAVNSVGESSLSSERSAIPAGAPSAPALSAATPSNTMVTVSWATPSGNGSTVTGYRVYRSTSSGTETLYTTIPALNAFTDTNLTNGTTYYYKLTALNAVGESNLSNERSGTPVAPATTPGAPTLNSAAPGNNTVSLDWSAPASDGGSAITGYRVYRSTTSGNETLLTTLGPATSFTDTGLTNGSTYYYKVSAVNSVGESGLSSERSAMAAGTPSAPALNAATPSNTMLTISWATPSGNGSTVTGYRVYRSTSSGTETLYTTIPALNAFTDTNLTNGTTYYYKLTALNAVGESNLSNERSGTPGAPASVPGAPGLDSASPGAGMVTLNWSAPTSNGGSAVTGYRVYRSTNSGNETLLTTLGPATSYADSNLANGTTYYYVVSAVNGVGESLASNERSAKPVTTPDAPTLTAAVPGSNVALTWDEPDSDGGSSITGYRVYRSNSSGTETLLATVGAATSYTDEAPSPGWTYYYQVTAFSSVGESDPSNEMWATPPVSGDTTPPAKPGNLKALLSGTSQIALEWVDSTDNTSISYHVYRDATLVGTVQDSRFLDSGLTPGSTHVYQVRAVDGSGNESLPSSNLSARAASTSTGSTGTLAGVVHSQAGKLVGNAIVTLRLANGTLKSAKTNSSGVWKLSNLPGGPYALTLSLTGYQPASLNMSAVAGQTVLALATLTP